MNGHARGPAGGSSTVKPAIASTSNLKQLSDSELAASVSHARKAGKAAPRFRNWAKTYTCKPQSVFYPVTEEEVRRIVELAKRQKRCLRAFGEGHSPSDLVCVGPRDWLINVDALNGLVNVDSEKHIATVWAGTRLRDLHPLLRQHNLALSSLGSISDQSIAGAISTATHGSSLVFGNLSSEVREITLVLANDDTSLMTCSAQRNPDIFNASCCALGLTGIITRIAIQCEPAFNLEEEEFCMTADDFFASLGSGSKGSLPSSAEHVRGYWFPQVGEVKIDRSNRTNKKTILSSPSPISSPYSWFKDWISVVLLGYHWHQLALLIGRFAPNFLTWHARTLYTLTSRVAGPFYTRSYQKANPASKDDPSFPRCTPTAWRVGPSVELFNYDCLFPQYTYEGFVPLENAQACLREMQTWLEGECKKPDGLRHHTPIEIRFSAADQIWMSPTYQRPGCYIGIVQYKPYNIPVTYQELFDRFEAIIFKHGGKPHWAKSHTANRDTLLDMFPKLSDFLRVREIIDPHRVFANPYARRHFLGEWNDETSHKQFRTSSQEMEDVLSPQ